MIAGYTKHYNTHSMLMVASLLSAAASPVFQAVDFGDPPQFPSYTTHAGVDIIGPNDGAFGGLCQNDAFFNAPSKNLWREPTAVCDLLGCPRFGLRAGAPSLHGPYCIKGWVQNASVTSYLSQIRCGVSSDGSAIRAKTVNGSCNDPEARYTVCPDGGGDTMPLATVQGKPETVEKTCSANPKCVGFQLVSGGGGTLLQYGFSGNPYTGYATFTRIPRESVTEAPSTTPVETAAKPDPSAMDIQARIDDCGVEDATQQKCCQAAFDAADDMLTPGNPGYSKKGTLKCKPADDDVQSAIAKFAVVSSLNSGYTPAQFRNLVMTSLGSTTGREAFKSKVIDRAKKAGVAGVKPGNPTASIPTTRIPAARHLP